MFIPVGTNSQVILQVDKDADGQVTQKKLLDVMVSLEAGTIPVVLTHARSTFRSQIGPNITTRNEVSDDDLGRRMYDGT